MRTKKKLMLSVLLNIALLGGVAAVWFSPIEWVHVPEGYEIEFVPVQEEEPKDTREWI